jgi:hypothetical protein
MHTRTPFVLHKSPLQLDTLAIVQYLHSIGRPCTPAACVERNHPVWVHELPSIETATARYVGIGSCLDFWQKESGVDNLLEKAIAFKDWYPGYTISNNGG